MSIKKQFVKSKDAYKVTWTVDKKMANGAESIVLSGNFNNWSKDQDVFNKLKNGNFKLTMEFPKGESCEFRYLADGQTWFNDEEADFFVKSDVSHEENCALAL